MESSYNQWAQELRASKRPADGEVHNQTQEANYRAEMARQRRLMVKRARKIAMAKKKKMIEKAKSRGAMGTGAKMATNRFLRFSWFNLIPSFGLTLVYINLHVFFRVLFPSMFAKLGEEWIPMQERIGDNIQGVKMLSKGAGTVETMLLLLMDFLVILLVVISVAVLMMLLEMVLGSFGWLTELYLWYKS